MIANRSANGRLDGALALDWSSIDQHVTGLIKNIRKAGLFFSQCDPFRILPHFGVYLMSLAAKTNAIDYDPVATVNGNADDAWYEYAMNAVDQADFQRGTKISSVVGSGLLMLELTVLSLFLGQLICQVASLVPVQADQASTAAMHVVMAGMSSVSRVLPFCR